MTLAALSWAGQVVRLPLNSKCICGGWELPEAGLVLDVRRKRRNTASSPLALQKADGTCNTNFKKTQELEQVTKALEDFVDGNHGILVSWTHMPQIYQPRPLLL